MDKKIIFSNTPIELYKSPFAGDVKIRKTVKPKLIPGGILAKPIYVGICGSDYRIYTNEKKHQAGVMGHEAILQVEQNGSGISAFSPGDQIVINPINQEDQNDIIGYNGKGFLSRYFWIDPQMIAQKRVFFVPKEIIKRTAVFIEPLACCFHAQSKILQQIKDRLVMVLGAGSFGLLHYLLAGYHGAREVLIAAKSRIRIDEIRQREIAPADKTFYGDELYLWMNNQGLNPEVVIVTPNGVAPVINALKIVADNGHILLFGGLTPNDFLPGIALYNIRKQQQLIKVAYEGKTVNLVGSYGTDHHDFSQSIQILSKGGLGPERLVSHEVSIGDLPNVFSHYGAGIFNSMPIMKIIVRI